MRSVKEEKAFSDNLRREEPIKTDVIVELRAQNKMLWANQVSLLTNLINAEDALRVYRLNLLEQSKACAGDSATHCVPGCTKHEWRNSDGWHRKSEA